jgi:tetratricopeptide (TPR) repeat protein
VDNRQRWQALQSRIGDARTALNTGDRARALRALDAALEIDPEYLVAQSMRAQLLAPEAPAGEPVPRRSPEPAAPVGPPVNSPLPGGAYALLEERAKSRRIQSRLSAARAALAQSRVEQAASAIDELRELNPELPDLVALERALATTRTAEARSHTPWAVAAAFFAALLVGGLWLQNAPTWRVASRLSPALAPAALPPPAGERRAERQSPPEEAQLALSSPAALDASGFGVDAPPVPEDARDSGVEQAAGTSGGAVAGRTNVGSTGTQEPFVPRTLAPDPGAPVGVPEQPNARPPDATDLRGTPTAVSRDAASVRAEANGELKDPVYAVNEPNAGSGDRADLAAAEPAGPVVAVVESLASSNPLPPSGEATRSPVAAATTSSAVAAPSSAAVVDERTLVQEALQRYRSAYEELNAESARDVWPAVNAGALARAFDGLESQTLTFQDCDVQLDGAAAKAICRGTTRYVPKVGSRVPRTEPRRWSFSLRKQGGDWKIENARAER